MGNVQLGLAEDLNCVVCVDVTLEQCCILTEEIKEEEVTLPTSTDHSALDAGPEFLTGHPVLRLNLTPTSCDLHLLQSFIMNSFLPRGQRSYALLNRTGCVGCRLFTMHCTPPG